MIGLLSTFLPYILALCTALGGALMLRQGYNRQLASTQDRIIRAQEIERRGLQEEIDAVKLELRKQKRILSTVQFALKRRGLIISLDDGDFISLYDMGKQTTVTIPTQEAKPIEIAQEKEEGS